MGLTLLLVSVYFSMGAGQAHEGVRLDVTAGDLAVSDWVVEQPLDLTAAAQLLGHDGPVQTQRVRVAEVDAQGERLRSVAFQIDREEAHQAMTVTWRMPGATQPGQTRHFLVVLDGDGQMPAIDRPITVTADDDRITIVNGPVTLEHDRDFGGLIRRVTVGQAGGELRWKDKTWADWFWKGKSQYHLADHGAQQMSVLADGPLRVVVEARSAYLADGAAAISNPRATYRFTSYAGQSVTRVEALVQQDYARRWFYLHFADVDVAEASLDTFATDTQGGRWAAAHSDDLLVGIADSLQPGAGDGGVHAANSRVWFSSRTAWHATLFWGGGGRHLNQLKSWSAIADSPPKVTAHLAPLAARMAKVTAAATAMQEGHQGRHDIKQVVTHVALLAAREAGAKAAAGLFGAAEKSLTRAEAILRAGQDETDLRTTDGVVAGLVGGYPYLGNDQAAYVWSHVDDGAGLASIYQRKTKRQFIKVRSTAPRLWEIAVKKDEGGASYSNSNMPCSVRHQPHGLVLTWNGKMTVHVRATLKPDEAVLRMRMNGQARQSDEGFLTVVFPVVDGILPLTPGGVGDTIVDGNALGHKRPSPLVSGRDVSSHYPHSMQINAIYGDGQCLYVAEEDPEAHIKDLDWSAQPQSGTLNYSVPHPVGGWAGPDLIKDYASPGDVVIAPIEGDWYDAAQLYRKWALTAPWCRKGPIFARTDIPKWLAQNSYWTIGHLYTEEDVQEEIDKFEALGLPVGACHAYGYWYAPVQNGRYPELFPPKLGTEGFKQTISKLHRKGIRVVPYLLGSMWDQNTESWRTRNAAQGAFRGPDGQMNKLGYPARWNGLVLMCPGSKLWLDTQLDLSRELVGRYGAAGVYFDFLTAQRADCYNPDHGHELCGGRFFSRSVHDLYGTIRRNLKQINPDAIIAAEHNAECVLDVVDVQLVMSDEFFQGVPLFQAVYHDHALLYGTPGNRGAYRGSMEPHMVGHWWLGGCQNGWHNAEELVVQVQSGDPAFQDRRRHAENYVKLLHCHHHFGRPYLTYGKMLRPPRIEGEVPTMTDGTATFPLVQASAWRAPDGSVGVFILNYDKVKAYHVSLQMDLLEGAGWGADIDVTLSRWTREDGLVHVADVTGGKLRRGVTLEPWGLMALKLEPTR